MRSLPLTIALIVVWIIALSVVSGCAELQTAKGEAVMRAAEFSDTAADDAVFVICRAITVGTWRRKFGSDPERAAAWRALCAEPITQTP